MGSRVSSQQQLLKTWLGPDRSGKPAATDESMFVFSLTCEIAAPPWEQTLKQIHFLIGAGREKPRHRFTFNIDSSVTHICHIC